MNDHLGHVARSGDWDGDAYADLLVGGLGFGGSPKFWLYRGGPQGMGATPPQAALVITGVEALTEYAPALAFFDVDGDGLDDVVLGAPLWQDGEDPWGRTYVFLASEHQSSTTLQLTPADAQEIVSHPYQQPGVASIEHFGLAVGAAGDVDNDGFLDLIVGAPGNPVHYSVPGGTPAYGLGSAYVFLGTGAATGPLLDFEVQLMPPSATAADGDAFGATMDGVGDVDADGFDDVVITAIQAKQLSGTAYSHSGPGYATLFFGPDLDDRIEITPTVPDPTHAPLLFGHALTSGDLDNDGVPEIVITSPIYAIDDNCQGAAYIYRYDPQQQTLVSFASFAQPLWFKTHKDDPNDPEEDPPYLDDLARLGWSAAFVGQFDPDGQPPNPKELVFGAFTAANDKIDSPSFCTLPAEPQGGRRTGRILVVTYDQTLQEFIVQALYLGEQGEEGGKSRLGTMTAAGDFDGDGYIDIAGGASGYSIDGVSERGKISVFSNPVAP